jgi:pimeloyl-ACP methyl ester carboxylesterase
MKEIYLFSGLGADKKVFDFIDLSGYKLNFIDWIAPIESESIENYAQRLLIQIPAERPILIGVSFGGMIAIEVGKLIETEKIILISSARTKSDIPVYFRVIGKLRLHTLIPPRWLKSVNALTFWFFGTETEKEKNLLRAIIQTTDHKFLQWAIDKIVSWKNTTVLNNVTHIHGTTDKLLPLQAADIHIANGGHFMIVNKGDELSKRICEILR